MVVHDATQVVPTRMHAETAADLLVAEGAAIVLLHGSVARDAARPGSDVDLVAVFDDIDYSERWPLRWRLEAVCEAAVGVPFDVHVTDRPEWRHRTEQVPSSYEAAVASRHHLLRERAPRPGAAKWDKPIGMPTDNTEEALNRLENMTQALYATALFGKLDDNEVRIVDGKETVVPSARRVRLIGLCSHAAMTIETSLKAWRAAVGAESKRVHRIADLLEGAGQLPAAVENALAPLETNTLHPKIRSAFNDVSCWRKDGTYLDEGPQPEPDNLERLARHLAAAAPVVAGAVLRRLRDDGADTTDERFKECAAQMHRVRAALQTGDPVTGEPRPQVAPVSIMVPPQPNTAAETEQPPGLLRRLLRWFGGERSSARSDVVSAAAGRPPPASAAGG